MMRLAEAGKGIGSVGTGMVWHGVAGRDEAGLAAVRPAGAGRCWARLAPARQGFQYPHFATFGLGPPCRGGAGRRFGLVRLGVGMESHGGACIGRDRLGQLRRGLPGSGSVWSGTVGGENGDEGCTLSRCATTRASSATGRWRIARAANARAATSRSAHGRATTARSRIFNTDAATAATSGGSTASNS